MVETKFLAYAGGTCFLLQETFSFYFVWLYWASLDGYVMSYLVIAPSVGQMQLAKSERAVIQWQSSWYKTNT